VSKDKLNEVAASVREQARATAAMARDLAEVGEQVGHVRRANLEQAQSLAAITASLNVTNGGSATEPS
jgi:hypothetical protein